MEMTYLLQLAQLVGYVIIATIFIVMIKADVRVVKVQMLGIENQLDLLGSSFARLGDVMTQMAVQNTEIASIKEDLRELRHGRGFVVGIQGEYDAKGKVQR